MRVRLDLSALQRIKWYEYAIRFLFGGLITAAAGIIAKEFGAGVGGLFLAYPAIFPASATLVEKYERQKKERAGLQGTNRGREAAALDAAGAAKGSIGLLVFALLVWRLLPGHNAAEVLIGSAIAWLATSLAVWQMPKVTRRFRKKSHRRGGA